MDKISQYLCHLGFDESKKGYKYLYALIDMGLKNINFLSPMKEGYRFIAVKYGVSADTVEKDIQNLISRTWLLGNADILYQEFGATIDARKGKPSNKQFIFTALEKINYIWTA